MVGYYPTTSAGTVWECWTVSTVSTGDVWRTWTAIGTTVTSSSAGEAVWIRWTQQGTAAAVTTIRIGDDYLVAPPAPPPTPAELEARLEREKARRIEAEARAAREAALRKAAEQRAKKLLFQLLRAEQIREYVRHKRITIRAPSGTVYRLRHGWSGNVEELDAAGKPVNRLCIHPGVQVPVPDNLLTQKLMLETDEAAFRKIANITALN